MKLEPLERSIFIHTLRLVVVAVLLLLLAGCPKPVEKKGLVEVDRRQASSVSRMLAPGTQNMTSWTALAPAVTRSLEYVRTFPGHEPALRGEELTLTWHELAESLEMLRVLLPRLDDNPALLGHYFTWRKLSPNPLFTGYFEPVLEASLEKAPGYEYPIYRLPEDLKQADLGRFHPRWEGQKLIYRIQDGQVVPYYSRNEIDRELSLGGRDLEIAWAKDPVDVFFLQIQGSGRLKLPDGSLQRIQYAGKNGLQYVSLGRVMIERGLLSRDEVSMQSIRRVLEDDPKLIPQLLDTNPSYVFFRLESDGPFGAMGRVVTPMVSLATDPAVVPLGAVTVVDVGLPVPDSADTMRFVGLGLPQDTGGAIKGHRVDLFCGGGPRAEYLAGHLQNNGTLYLLLPRDFAAES